MDEMMERRYDETRIVGHRGHLVMAPPGWLLVEMANSNVPLMSLCGEHLMPGPDVDCDRCVYCWGISREMHNILFGHGEDDEECCTSDEGPERPPYNERAHDQWGLRYSSEGIVLLSRNCDEDGLNWKEEEQPWSDVAVFSRKHQADRAVKALRSEN